MIPPEGQAADEDEPTRRAKERVGRVLRDRWRLDELLGVGDRAAVYAGTHRMGKRVAIKMLHPELSQSSEVTQQFIEEGYAANRIGHPGVAPISDDGVAEDGAVFLVMDLFEGETRDLRMAKKGTTGALKQFDETGSLSPLSLRKHGRRALALGGALIIASIVWVGRMRQPEIGRSTQAVLVSAATPVRGQALQVGSDPIGCAPTQNPANVDKADPILELARDRSESEPFNAKTPASIARAVRKHGGKRNPSLPKFAARPAGGEDADASTSAATPVELATASISPGSSIDLTRRSPSLFADLLDRRK